jgi:hypothetical protein
MRPADLLNVRAVKEITYALLQSSTVFLRGIESKKEAR